MKFEVVFIGENELPEQQDWALVRCATTFYAFIKRTRLTADLLACAWAAFVGYVRDLMAQQGQTHPLDAPLMLEAAS